MITIPEDQIAELIEYRKFFKDPQFFKIFRMFYALAVVPEDVQNNPFLLFIDKESVIRNFHNVFDEDNEEIAIRFYNVLLMVKNEKPVKFEDKVLEKKKGEIDVVQYFRTIKKLCHNNIKETTEYMKLAFRFLDYDDDGNIGSVDILNLRKSLNHELVERI